MHELTKPKNSARGRLGWVTNYVSYALLFIKEGELPLQIAARRGQYPSRKIIFILNCEADKKKAVRRIKESWAFEYKKSVELSLNDSEVLVYQTYE